MAITEELFFGVIASSEIMKPNMCSYYCCGPGAGQPIFTRDLC